MSDTLSTITASSSTPSRGVASLLEQVLQTLEQAASTDFPIALSTQQLALDPVFLFRLLSVDSELHYNDELIEKLPQYQTAFAKAGMLSTQLESLTANNAYFAREVQKLKALPTIVEYLLLESAPEAITGSPEISQNAQLLTILASLGKYLLSWYFPELPRRADARSQSTGGTLSESVTHLLGYSPIEISSMLISGSAVEATTRSRLARVSRIDRAGAISKESMLEKGAASSSDPLEDKPVLVAVRSLRFADLLLSGLPTEDLEAKLRLLSHQSGQIISSLKEQRILSGEFA